MRVLLPVLLILAASTAAVDLALGQCELRPFRAQIRAGKDERSYFVTVTPPQGWPSLSAHSSLAEAVDYLALEQGVTVVYLTDLTERAVPKGEWRGATPFDALREFARDAGVQVAIPAPDFWVISGPRQELTAAVTLFVHTLDPARQPLSSFPGGIDLARSVLNLLPVRDIDIYAGNMALGVGYYWLPDEGPGSALVVASRSGIDNPERCFFRVFRIRVRQDGQAVTVDCIWESRDVSGRFVPEIAEDFDGDGRRDFVFDSDGRDNAAAVILSGRHGRSLVSFLSNEVAVEKLDRGPVRFAIDELVGMDVHDGQEWSEGVGAEGPLVLRAIGSDEEFEIWDDRSLEGGSPQAATEKLASRALPRQILAKAVGGAERVRVYLLQPGAALPGWGFEEVAQQRYHWKLAPPPEGEAKGEVSRILLRYETPGFRMKMLERRSRAR